MKTKLTVLVSLLVVLNLIAYNNIATSQSSVTPTVTDTTMVYTTRGTPPPWITEFPPFPTPGPVLDNYLWLPMISKGE